MTNDEYILACDVGGTRLRVALVKTDGAVLTKEVTPTPQQDPSALVKAMRSMLDRSPGRVVTGAVVGLPGPVDYSLGEALRLPNLPAWEGHISAAGLSKELEFTVLLANDADLAALGEHRFGAGRGAKDMVYLTSSTGVGGGVVINGQLLHGRLSLAEVGHTIIDRASHGTVESLGSGTALERLAGEDAASVAARAAAGDLEARRQWDQVAGDFAIGVFNMVHLFSPEVVVIGGGMSWQGDLLLDPIRALLGKYGHNSPTSRARVVKAAGDDDVGLKGAAAFWTDYLG